MTMADESDRTTERRGPKISLKRAWLRQAVEGDLEIQRLSRMALKERRRHSYRYRMVQHGAVIALFQSREDVWEALGNPEAPTFNETLYRRLTGKAEPSGSVPSRTMLDGYESPDSPYEEAAVEAVFRAPDREPPVPVPPPPPLPRDQDSPRAPPPRVAFLNAPETAERKVSFESVRQAPTVTQEVDDESPEEDAKEEEEGAGYDSPRGEETWRPEGDPEAKKIAAMKAVMTPEQRAARRASLWKPPASAQEPDGAPEAVMVWYFDDLKTEWTTARMQVRIAEEPFAEGAMRLAYRMEVVDGSDTSDFVAKRFNKYTETELITPKKEALGATDPDKVVDRDWVLNTLRRKNLPFETEFAEKTLPLDWKMTAAEFLAWLRRVKLFRGDIEMQGFCRTLAQEYNKLDPPKEVFILEAFLIVCMDRPDRTVYACEPMITGDYVKHNNNSGEVTARSLEKNTPQAFSHFTNWFTKGKHIIVDIQGVENTYTDPQVHSTERRFGLGNLGQEGIDAFFKTHRCNNVCVGLGLAEGSRRVDVKGTVFMRSQLSDDD